VVSSNYSSTGGSVQFALIATTSTTDANRTAWISDSQPLSAVTDLTASAWTIGLETPITSVGLGGQNSPAAPAGTNYAVLAPTSPYSFDYLASANGNSPGAIPYLGGSSGINFEVTAATPNTVLFYAIQPSTSPAKPVATLVGSFTLYGDGTLVFQAGPLLDAPTITSIAAGGNNAAVTFTTKPAVKYRLIYTTLLSNNRAGWTVLPNPVAGDGTPGTLYDQSATDTQRLYSVQSYP
jgi:hypothetical protein